MNVFAVLANSILGSFPSHVQCMRRHPYVQCKMLSFFHILKLWMYIHFILALCNYMPYMELLIFEAHFGPTDIIYNENCCWYSFHTLKLWLNKHSCWHCVILWYKYDCQSTSTMKQVLILGWLFALNICNLMRTYAKLEVFAHVI